MANVYQQLGDLVKDDVLTFSGEKPDKHAPRYLVVPTSFSHIDTQHITNQPLLIDLGVAFLDTSPPIHGVGTPVSYCSPELLTEKKASKASDIWALACTIFEMRAGFPLFESFLGSSTQVLQEITRILGLLPAGICYSKEVSDQMVANPAQWDEAVLKDRVLEIGNYDQQSSEFGGDMDSRNFHTMIEPLGQTISNEEATELTDLLRKMLDYAPNERLSTNEITNHIWFKRNE